MTVVLVCVVWGVACVTVALAALRLGALSDAGAASDARAASDALPRNPAPPQQEAAAPPAEASEVRQPT